MGDASSPAFGRAAAATRSFYEWEIHGRGWHGYDHPVMLEPACVPFMPETRSGAIDDGRRETLLSSLWRRTTGETAPVVQPPAPERSPYPGIPAGEWIEFRLSVRDAGTVLNRPAPAWLKSLALAERPLAFEMVGGAGDVSVQVAAATEDATLVADSLASYFPSVAAVPQPSTLGGCFQGEWMAVLEFGLAREFVIPLPTDSDADPLTPLLGTLAALKRGVAAVQVLWQPVVGRWADAIATAVYTDTGEPFFADAPEISRQAADKAAHPLYAVALRLVASGDSESVCWQTLRRLASGLSVFGAPGGNDLIPLSGHPDVGLTDVLSRTSHRTGMILNLRELSGLVHLPVLAGPVTGYTLQRASAECPADLAEGEITLGVNRHRGQERVVRLSSPNRLRHLHIVGASGTGKSTLILSLIEQDMKAGRGLALVDPHGDLVEEALALVPAERERHVVLLDPGCRSHVVGWNVLSGDSEAEREMLSSDLTAVFRRLSTSWGDQMTTVLDNALAVFLESGASRSLTDVRRFFVDRAFREQMVAGVSDEYVRSYWQQEFPLIASRHPEASILTRLNGFLRAKTVRRTVTERQRSINFRALVDGGGILLAKLAQGTIGRENSALLGSLLVSKIHQTALFRQDIPQDDRAPFHLYIDEFHEVAVPSMSALFTGARKYRLGLVIAHQDLEQLRASAPELEQAVIANANTRICFRLGERDARELSHGFARFSADDLGSLDIGQAIARVGGRERDFNLTVKPAGERDGARREEVRRVSLEQYGRPLATDETVPPRETPAVPTTPTVLASAPPEPIPEPVGEGGGGPEHQYLQELVRQFANEYGFRATLEAPVDGGRVDVVLEREDRRVACEIAVTSGVEHELANVRKCLAAGFSPVFVVSRRKRFLRELRSALSAVTDQDVRPVLLEEFPAQLASLIAGEPAVSTVAGYRVRVERRVSEDAAARARIITAVMTDSLRRLEKDNNDK